MKNKFKKLLAFAIFAIMAMAMAVTAMADDPTYTVNITANGGASVKNTYEVYQIATFDVETTDGDTVYTNIKVNPNYNGVFDPTEAAKITTDSAAADQLAVTLAGESKTDTAVTTTSNGAFTVKSYGYYLIKEIAHDQADAYLATKYILVAVDAAEKTVELKTSNASITKKIVLEGTTDTLVDKNVAAIGDVVTYQLDATIPAYPTNATGLSYIITDTLSSGLTYKAVTYVGIKTASESAYTDVTTTAIAEGGWLNNNGQTTTITVPEATVKANAGGSVKITLTATLNASANVGTMGNPNSVDLKYTNNWDKKDSYYETPKDTVITYTGALNIIKTDDAAAEAAKPLSGAEFAIYTPKKYNDAETVPADAPEHVKATIEVKGVTYYYYKMVTTGTDGKASVTGRDSGMYYAVESKAPAGYNVVTTPVKLELVVAGDQLEVAGDPVDCATQPTLDAANSHAEDIYTVTWIVNDKTEERIQNTKGNTLPGTGGMGTTIFTIGGIVLVALAALMFVVYMRKQKKQA